MSISISTDPGITIIRPFTADYTRADEVHVPNIAYDPTPLTGIHFGGELTLVEV